MREMGGNILLDMVLCVHSGWTCLLNMEMGAFLGRSGELPLSQQGVVCSQIGE